MPSGVASSRAVATACLGSSREQGSPCSSSVPSSSATARCPTGRSACSAPSTTCLKSSIRCCGRSSSWVRWWSGRSSPSSPSSCGATGSPWPRSSSPLPSWCPNEPSRRWSLASDRSPRSDRTSKCAATSASSGRASSRATRSSSRRLAGVVTPYLPPRWRPVPWVLVGAGHGGPRLRRGAQPARRHLRRRPRRRHRRRHQHAARCAAWCTDASPVGVAVTASTDFVLR